MHSKQKGSIGETAVAKKLLEEGFNVFFDYGDLSKIDLIAEKNSQLYRIQVKSRSCINDVVELDSRKSGPNYSFKYDSKDLDFFAVYVPEKDHIFYVTSKELCAFKTIMTLRYTIPKNNIKNVHMISDYTLERCLRDCTRCTPTDNAVGDDTVQTTTT